MHMYKSYVVNQVGQGFIDQLTIMYEDSERDPLPKRLTIMEQSNNLEVVVYYFIWNCFRAVITTLNVKGPNISHGRCCSSGTFGSIYSGELNK